MWAAWSWSCKWQDVRISRPGTRIHRVRRFRFCRNSVRRNSFRRIRFHGEPHPDRLVITRPCRADLSCACNRHSSRKYVVTLYIDECKPGHRTHLLGRCRDYSAGRESAVGFELINTHRKRRALMFSKIIFNNTVSGTARNIPTIPHIQLHVTSAKSMVTGLMPIRSPTSFGSRIFPITN